ncbi:MAG: hypothetical protein U0325_06400 [Polyangiales bacterium]
MTPRGLAGLALALGCGPRRPPTPPRPAQCATETVAGLRTRAVAWSQGRWVAAIPEGQSLALRAFNDRGEVQGDARGVLDEPVRPQDVCVSPTATGVLVAAATQMGDLRVLAVDGDTVREAEGARLSTDGEFALVPRPDEPARPAGLFYAMGAQTLLRLIDRDGAPRAAATCPPGLSPRAVAAWHDTFVAATHRDGVALLVLDDACRVRRRVPLARDAVATPPAVAVDGDGAVVTWTADRAWIAGADAEGALRIRPTALEPDTAHAGLVLAPDAQGRRAEIRVIALRRNEIQSRMELYRFDPRGTLRDVGGLTAAPTMRVAGVAEDPWGGAMIAWGRPEAVVSGSTSARALPFFTRLCP